MVFSSFKIIEWKKFKEFICNLSRFTYIYLLRFEVVQRYQKIVYPAPAAIERPLCGRPPVDNRSLVVQRLSQMYSDRMDILCNNYED